MIVLDSSAIINIIAGNQKGREIEMKFGEDLVATTSISINEVLTGMNPKEREKIINFFNGLELLDFNAKAAYKSIEIEEKLKTKEKIIGKLDIFIASICILNDFTILTSDKDFKNIDGLKLICI